MYKRLLLAEGGGVIEAAQQAEQEDCAVVAIGLGGTGVDCLRNLKRKVYNRIKPDDPDAAVPDYAHIKYLAIDSDMKGMDSVMGEFGELDPTTEFLGIAPTCDLSELFDNGFKPSPECSEWLRYDSIKASGVNAGAGGVRQIGRYLLFGKAQEFTNRLEAIINQARMNLPSPQRTYIHIFAGISGGTGSGTFLDVCYLTRQVVKNMGISARIAGYFFLPDVNLSKPSLPGLTRKWIQENGYEAMRELDYCMDFERNGDEWHQEYPGVGVVRFKQVPVDLCHLVSATAGGATLENAYDYAMNVVTDYVLDFDEKAVNDANAVFDFDQHFSNIQKANNKITRSTGSCYSYLVLGAASGVVPYTRMLTYLATRVFADLAGLVSDRVPSEQESLDFQTRVGVTTDAVKGMVSGGEVAFSTLRPKARDVKEGNVDLVGHYEAQLQRLVIRFRENAENRSRPVLSYGPEAVGDTSMPSLMERVLKEVRDVMADTQQGPFFAAELVKGAKGKDLHAACLGIKAGAKEQLDHCKYNDNVQREEQEKARRAFEGSNLFTQGKALEKWESHLYQCYMFRAEAAMWEQVIDVMDTLAAQLDALSSKFLVPFREMVRELIATFAANGREIAAHPDGENGYEVPLVTFNEVLPLLNKALQDIDVAAKGKDLLGRLIGADGITTWGPGGDENRLCALVSHELKALFHKVSGLTLDKFLEEKYGAKDPNQLAVAVYNDLLTRVDEKAAPMFWSASGYAINQDGLLGYVTFPSASSTMGLAFGKLKAAKTELEERKGVVQDRISILRMISGIPMWGYRGIVQYERKALVGQDVGTCFYEQPGGGEDKDRAYSTRARDWHLLPSPSPLSRMNADDNDATLLRRAQAARDLYDQAEQYGVIGHNELKETFIRRLDQQYCANLQQQIASTKALPDGTAERNQANQALKGQRATLQWQGETIVFARDEDPHADIIQAMRVDQFVNSPVLQAIVHDEVKRIEQFDRDIEEATKQHQVDTSLVAFAEALCLGVFTVKPTFISYEDDETGEPRFLDKAGMPFSLVPLYQAFVSFKGLDREQRDGIDQQVKDRKDGLDPAQNMAGYDEAMTEATEVCDAIAARLSKSETQAMNRDANANYPDQANDIATFIKDLRNQVATFGKTTLGKSYNFRR